MDTWILAPLCHHCYDSIIILSLSYEKKPHDILRLSVSFRNLNKYFSKFESFKIYYICIQTHIYSVFVHIADIFKLRELTVN